MFGGVIATDAHWWTPNEEVQEEIHCNSDQRDSLDEFIHCIDAHVESS